MKRTFFAILIGLLGATFIWIAAPLNKHLLNNGLVSDSYFPEIAVLVMLILILGINPLLRAVSKNTLFLNTRQLALIFGILLMACTLPTQGLLRQFPFGLAKTTERAALNPQLAEIHKEMNLPKALFPDTIAYGEDTPNSTYLMEELPDGAAIPWKAWIPPLISWGALLVAIWMMMIGMGMIVYPQWRDNERLPFPLLTLEHELIGGIDAKNSIPAIFKDKLFWLGCGMVFSIYLLNGLSAFTDGKWPSFPLGWNLSSAFSEEPWRHLNWRIKSVHKLYFVLIGITYFMPNRISFSIWFTTLAYGAFQMLDITYTPPHDAQMVTYHRHGATLAIGLMVLFTGRSYWVKVFRSMFRRSLEGEDARNRMAGWIFFTGCLGMVCWLVWVGISPVWALVLLFSGFITALVIARIVAETGLPFIRITAMQPSWLPGIFPTGMISASLLYISGFLSLIFTLGSRISPAAMMPHVLGLDKDITPKQQSRLPFLMLIVLTLGLGVAGAVTLKYGYSRYASLDGRDLTSSSWGSRTMSNTENQLLALSRDAHKPITSTQVGQVATGGVMALGLTFACLSSAAWPLHPIGLLMVGGFYAGVGWASILIGWCLKSLILRYGGAGIYKKLRNLFIGMILGEIFAAVVWALVPVILILNGADPTQIGRLGVLPG